jgi:hypothetical protein
MNLSMIMFIITGGCLAVGIFLYVSRIKKLKSELAKLSKKRKHYTIATLSPVLPPPYNNLVRHTIGYLKKYAPFDFDTIECFVNENESFQEWVQFIIEKKPDLIYTQTEYPLNVLRSSMEKSDTHIPIVAGVIPLDCHNSPLPEGEQKSSLHILGITLGWEEKIAILKATLPFAKKALIISNSPENMKPAHLKERNAILVGLRKARLESEIYHFEKNASSNTKLPNDIGVIIITHTIDVVKNEPLIVKMAKDKGIPIFSLGTSNKDIFISVSNDYQHVIIKKAATAIIEQLNNEDDNLVPVIKNIHKSDHIHINPLVASPLTTTTAIGALMKQCNTIRIKLKKMSELPVITIEKESKEKKK